MATEFIIKFHGDRKQTDDLLIEETTRSAVIQAIEDCEQKLAYVLEIVRDENSCRDITADIREQLCQRERERLTDQYYEEYPDMTLEMFIWSHANFAEAA